MKARGGGPYVNEVITYGHHTPAGVVDQLLMSAAMCLISAWLAVKLHRACD